MAEKLTLSVKEVAEILDIGLATAYGGIHRGEIPSIRVGRRLGCSRSTVAARPRRSPTTSNVPD